MNETTARERDRWAEKERERKEDKPHAGTARTFPEETFCLFADNFRGVGDNVGVSFLRFSRLARRERGRKGGGEGEKKDRKEDAVWSAFRSRALTQTDILFSRSRASGGAASYRGRFNFNLEKPRKPRGCGEVGEEVCAIPRFCLIAAPARPARLAHVRALQLSRLAAITVSDRRRLRSPKVNRWYCAQG